MVVKLIKEITNGPINRMVGLISGLRVLGITYLLVKSVKSAGGGEG